MTREEAVVTCIKALTVRQPHASLIALGIKTIETRPWRTHYRGPLAIHAGKHTLPKWNSDRSDHDADWVNTLDSLGVKFRTDKSGDWYQPILPLGAVVATCTLTDCVPIVDAEDYDPAVGPYPALTTEPMDGDYPDGWLDLYHPTLGALGELGTNKIKEAPYGDFSPGRWAWMLDDIEPLAEPIEAKGRQGLWDWADERSRS